MFESAQKMEFRESNNAFVARLSQVEGDGAEGLPAGGRASLV